MYKNQKYTYCNSKNRGYSVLYSMVFVVSLIMISVNLLASTETDLQGIDEDTLNSVAELYGISETRAIDRMAREADAAHVLRKVEELSIESYAGSWFDPSTMKLKVAIANPNDLEHLEWLDVEPVIVQYSLATLRERLKQALAQTDALENVNLTVKMSYVDVKANKAVLEVDRPSANVVRSALSDFVSMVDVVENDSKPVLSTGN